MLVYRAGSLFLMPSLSFCRAIFFYFCSQNMVFELEQGLNFDNIRSQIFHVHSSSISFKGHFSSLEKTQSLLNNLRDVQSLIHNVIYQPKVRF